VDEEIVMATYSELNTVDVVVGVEVSVTDFTITHGNA